MDAQTGESERVDEAFDEVEDLDAQVDALLGELNAAVEKLEQSGQRPDHDADTEAALAAGAALSDDGRAIDAPAPTSAPEEPTDEAPSDGPSDENLSDEATTDETPTEEALSEEAALVEELVDDVVAQEGLDEVLPETSADEATTDDTPTDEAAPDETPSDEAPSEPEAAAEDSEPQPESETEPSPTDAAAEAMAAVADDLAESAAEPTSEPEPADPMAAVADDLAEDLTEDAEETPTAEATPAAEPQAAEPEADETAPEEPVGEEPDNGAPDTEDPQAEAPLDEQLEAAVSAAIEDEAAEAEADAEADAVAAAVEVEQLDNAIAADDALGDDDFDDLEGAFEDAFGEETGEVVTASRPDGLPADPEPEPDPEATQPEPVSEPEPAAEAPSEPEGDTESAETEPASDNGDRIQATPTRPQTAPEQQKPAKKSVEPKPAAKETGWPRLRLRGWLPDKPEWPEYDGKMRPAVVAWRHTRWVTPPLALHLWRYFRALSAEAWRRADPHVAKGLGAAYAPIAKQDPLIRSLVGYFAVWTAFLAVCAWVFVAFFQGPDIRPIPDDATGLAADPTAEVTSDLAAVETD